MEKTLIILSSAIIGTANAVVTLKELCTPKICWVVPFLLGFGLCEILK